MGRVFEPGSVFADHDVYSARNGCREQEQPLYLQRTMKLADKTMSDVNKRLMERRI